MIETLKQLGLLDLCLTVSSIFIIVMCIVYIPGRLLGIVHYWRIKNAIAILSSIGISYLNLTTFSKINVHKKEFIYTLILYSSIVIIMYVLIGMRLFERIDNFLDRKIGKDKSHHRPK